LNLVVIGAFWVLFVTRRRRGQSSDNGQPAGATPTPQSRLKPIETLAEIDPSFDQDAFCQWLEQIYVHMQEAWTAGDFTPMRVYFSNTLYAQFDCQLAALRLNHHTNHVDDIVVQNVVLRGWYEAGGEQCLVVNIRARIVDYTVDDDSGAVVAGDTHTRKLMTYEYTFARTTGAQSATADGTHTVACPNCGGAVDINQSAKCTHCGAILNARDYNWTIVEIKGLSQQNLR